MKIVFTKNEMILSKVIRWGLKEPVSHMGIVHGDIIFHINLLGAHIEYLPTFEKHNEVVFSIESSLDHRASRILFWNIVKLYDGLAYDFTGLMFFMWRGFLWRFFKIDFPKKNEMQAAGQALCVKVADNLPLSAFPISEQFDDIEMVSPYKIFLALYKSVMNN